MLDSLPEIIIEKISEKLDFETRLRLSQTSKTFRRLTNEIWETGLIQNFGIQWEVRFNFFLILEINFFKY